MKNKKTQHPAVPTIPLSTSITFLLGRKKLLGWSFVLIALTVFLTWTGFLLTTGLVDHYTASLFDQGPTRQSWWGWIKYGGWLVAKYLYVLVTRLIAFFLAFLLAYTLTTPFYSFLSNSAEKIFWGKEFQDDDGFTLAGIAKDLFEGAKIALFGVLVTVVALAVGFVPIVGQLTVFLIYTYYSALMFVDYPASRRRWSLGRKLSWLRHYSGHTFRLGLIPAAVSMIPLLNVFLLACIFPLFTVHAALNFSAVEASRSRAR
jgi:CysZ protein